MTLAVDLCVDDLINAYDSKSSDSTLGYPSKCFRTENLVCLSYYPGCECIRYHKLGALTIS